MNRNRIVGTSRSSFRVLQPHRDNRAHMPTLLGQQIHSAQTDLPDGLRDRISPVPEIRHESIGGTPLSLPSLLTQ